MPFPSRRALRRLAALTAGLVMLAPALVAPQPAVAGSTRYRDTVMADRPAAYWRLGETSGTTAADVTGRLAGTFRNAPALGRAGLISGDGNRAVGLDGKVDDVRVPSASSVNASTAVTLEAWIQPSRLPASGSTMVILQKNGAWSLRLYGPYLRFVTVHSGVSRVLTAPSGTIRAGTRYHVAATWDGAYQRIYVNGRLVASRAQGGSLAVTTGDVFVGSGGTWGRFAGTVDDVAVYRTRLSSSRVALHALVGRTGENAIRTGMATHFMWQSLSATIADLDRMKAARMQYVRFDFSWANSEPVKGDRRYFDKLDAVLDEIAKRGMRVTVTVIETPSWANGGKGKMAPPTYPADYARFVGALARHTAARPGMTWEIWNEPNDPHFWTTGPSAAAYSRLLKASYSAIKANDPDATVLGGSILFNDTAFLKGMYANGAKGYFDGLSIHPYCKGYAPGSTADPYFSFKRSVPAFTSVMKAYGEPSKPIWITEMGWSTSKVSDATRAIYLRDAVTIARSWTNVRGMAAYTLHQSQYAAYGLLTTTNAATRSWNAYVAAQ